jgi:hypothetical protein
MMRIPASPEHTHAPLRRRLRHEAGRPHRLPQTPQIRAGGDRKVGLKAWEDWGKRNAAAIVATDVMVGKTRRVTKSGIADAQNQIVGFLIVEAADIAAAAGLFQDHPHITVFPGDGIDVMPVVTGPPED